MPKLWTTTIEAHRQQVRAAVVQATAALVAARGLSGVRMSAIAAEAGVGRATLYKYFPDVGSILAAWHEDVVAEHVARLRAIAEGPGTAADRLKQTLTAYAELKRQAGGHDPHGSDVAAELHRSSSLQGQHDALRTLFEELIRSGADSGDLRSDVAAGELAAFALSALAGAALAPSRAAAHRLVQLTFDALTKPPA